MKKILLILSFLIISHTTYAQLSITGKSDKIETIATARAKAVALKKHGDHYYIVMHSDNRFDNPPLFEIGDSWDEAFQTLRDLDNLFDTLEIGESVYVKNYNEDVRIDLQNFMGSKILFFDIPGIAGTVWMQRMELRKFQKYLNQSSPIS